MLTDPIADYLTRVRNAQMAGKKVVEIPASLAQLVYLSNLIFLANFFLK